MTCINLFVPKPRRQINASSKYRLEQRKEWCEACLRGEHVPTPLGARRATFIRELRDWARKYKRFGPASIGPSAKRKNYPMAAILAAASLVASGEMSTKEAAKQFGVMKNEMCYGLEGTHESFAEFKRAVDE